MTYRRKVLILTSISVFLLTLFLLSFLFSQERSESRKSAALIDPRVLDSLARIDIVQRGGAERFSLTKQEGAWSVLRDGLLLPAKRTRIDEALRFLSVSAQYFQVSASGKSLEFLGLGEAAAARLSLFDKSGKSLLDIAIGDWAPNGKSVFFRRLSSDDAFQGGGRLAEIASGGSRDWLDAALFPSAPRAESVERVSVRSTAMTYAFSRSSSSSWRSDGSPGLVLDSSKIDAWLASFLSLYADDLAGAAAPDSSSFEIVLDMADGSAQRCFYNLAPAADGLCLLSVAGRPYSFLIAKPRLDRLTRSEADFAEAVRN